ncbi:MAG: FHA domain-containing protein [Anaerolineae bacterium]|nr:FHA domain-containing protein [Anaerolineae bacterium]
MNKDVVALGRDITNDIVINDPEVSRHHCRLTRTPAGYSLEDLGSTNGTFVNGQRLTAARPLMNGDMIGLGETVTLVYEGGAAQQAGPPRAQEAPAGERQPAQPVHEARPSQPAYAQPEEPAQPSYEGYAVPQEYQPPAQPYAEQGAGYEYYEYEQQQQGNNTGRLIAIGCGCLVVLCVVAVGIIGFVIDYLNLWCDIPLMPELFNLQCPANISMLLPALLPFL